MTEDIRALEAEIRRLLRERSILQEEIVKMQRERDNKKEKK